jgi:hypothetical protein
MAPRACSISVTFILRLSLYRCWACLFCSCCRGVRLVLLSVPAWTPTHDVHTHVATLGLKTLHCLALSVFSPSRFATHAMQRYPRYLDGQQDMCVDTHVVAFSITGCKVCQATHVDSHSDEQTQSPCTDTNTWR